MLEEFKLLLGNISGFLLLINEFYKLTNMPILLNTSFNENEPIVMKPQDAINV